MFEWCAAFVKSTGKLSWWGVTELFVKCGALCNAEPTTVLGCVVVGTGVVAGAYLFGPDFTYHLSIEAHAKWD